MKRYFKAFAIGAFWWGVFLGAIWGLIALYNWYPRFWDALGAAIVIVVMGLFPPMWIGYNIMDGNGTWKKKEEEA